MSLQEVYRGTFAGPDRLGNLLPALTMWIHNPTDNAYAQIALRLGFGVLAPVFFCSLVFPRAIDSWRAALVTQLLLVLGIKPTLAWEAYVEALPYGTALACAGFATLALRAAWTMRRRARWLLYIFGVTVLTAAYVTDVGLLLFAVPPIGLLALVLRSVFLQRLLIVHLLVAAVGFILPKVVFFGTPTPLGLAFTWPNELHFLRSVTADMGWPFVCAMALPVLLSLGLVKWQRFRHGRRTLIATLAAMLTVGPVCFLVVASSRWVDMNQFLPRYFIPGYVLLMSMAGVSLLSCCKYGIHNRALSGTTFICIAMVLLLTGAARLTGWSRDTQGIIGNRKGSEAWAVAGQYLGQHLDAIARRLLGRLAGGIRDPAIPIRSPGDGWECVWDHLPWRGPPPRICRKPRREGGTTDRLHRPDGRCVQPACYDNYGYLWSAGPGIRPERQAAGQPSAYLS